MRISRKLYRLLAYSCICLLHINMLYGQSLLFSKLNASHGLSENNARTLTIDKNGFLWIGTSQGLNLYDGYTVRTYFKEHNPELPSDVIVEVKADSKNNVWIGTPEGASWLDKNRRFHRVTINDTLQKFGCPSIFETKKYGIILFGDKGQFYYDSSINKWKKLDWIPPALNRVFWDTEKFADDKFIFCVDTLVTIIDYSTHKTIYQGAFSFPLSACKINESQIAIGLQKGHVLIVDIRTGKTVKTYELKHKLNGQLLNSNLTEVRQASNGDLLVATDLNGLVVISQDGKITEHTHDPLDAHSLSSNYTYRVLAGSKGEVIVGTYTSGANLGNVLNKSAGYTRVFKDKEGNLFDNYLTDIAAGDNGVFWIGAMDRLIKWNRTTNQSEFYTNHTNTEFGVRPYEIRSIFPLHNNKILVGTNGGGLTLFDVNTNKFKNIPRDSSLGPAAASRGVMEMVKLSNGSLWVGTLGGLFALDPETFKVTSFSNHPQLKELDKKRVFKIYEDRRGRIWIGTSSHGAYVYDPLRQTIRNYSTKENLPSNSVYSITGDKKGNIFISSNTGFTVLDPTDHILNYTYNKGLRYNYCQDLLEDSISGTIWIANTRCLIKFNPADSSMQYFEENSGLSIEGFRIGSSFKTNDGEMLWGSRSGVNYFHPDKLVSIPSRLTLSIQDLKFNGETRHITDNVSLRLTYLSNDISFYFSAVNLYGSKNIHYQYKLSGYEKDWHTGIDIREAHYTSLPTGNFSFEVRASLDGINWIKSNNSVSVYIVPPIWQRWWFITACIIVLAGSFLWLFVNRNKKILEQREEIEMEQAINYFATNMYEAQTVETILWEVARSCIGRLGFEDCVIYLLDEKRQVLVQTAAHGPKSPAENQITNLIEIPLGKGIVGSVALSGKAEIIDDTSKDPRYIIDDAFRLSEITVPIISDGKVLGVVDCEHSIKGFFTQKHLSILNTIASLCANKIIRIRAEKEREKAQAILMDTQHKMAEIEMQALRAQMNPHFIFNCLNSINRYIVKSDQATASLYLTRFAKLIRLILDNSNNKNVILANELEALKLYIEMEALRFDKKFTYSIVVDESVCADSVEVPPLIIQPYVENAIWHGLLHKETEGYLLIYVSKLSENMIKVVIEDNGVGREKAKELRSKSATTRKSLGMKLTENRLSLLNKYAELTASVDIIDLKTEGETAEGTKVVLKIPIL
ncbi:two-component regulator propeller domain-containing protein [Flavitalea sp.]|nr:two-component regulator propeller domain-containing protein [Flavitalea sp.]